MASEGRRSAAGGFFHLLLATAVGLVAAVLATMYLEDWLLPELPDLNQDQKAVAATLSDFQLVKILGAAIIGTFIGAFIAAWTERGRAILVACYVGGIMLWLDWGRFAAIGYPAWMQADTVFGICFVTALAGWLMRLR